MKTTNKNTPLFDHDKQTKPLDGEVSSKDAQIKAALFAAREKMLIKQKK